MKFIIFFGICLLHAAKSDILLPFYNIVANSSSCDVLNNTANHMSPTVSDLDNGVELTLPISRENVNVSSAVITLAASSQNWTATVNAIADSTNETFSTSITEKKEMKWTNTENGNPAFKWIVITSTDFSSSDNTSTACLDLALVYNATVSTNYVTAIDLGCWTWTNNSKTLNHTDSGTNITEWALTINKEVCSSATNLLTPPFLIIIAFVINSMVKQ